MCTLTGSKSPSPSRHLYDTPAHGCLVLGDHGWTRVTVVDPTWLAPWLQQEANQGCNTTTVAIRSARTTSADESANNKIARPKSAQTQEAVPYNLLDTLHIPRLHAKLLLHHSTS